MHKIACGLVFNEGEMEFYSLSFVSLIILSIVLFWAIPERFRSFRKWILILGSAVFLWDNTMALCFVFLSGFINAVGLRWVLLSKKNSSWTVMVIVMNILFLVFYKMAGASWSHWAGDWVMPLGLSFYTFQNIGAWVRVRQEDWEEVPDLLDYLIYTVYFPKMLSGPVEPWEKFQSQLQNIGKQYFDEAKITQALRYILWGAFAKWVVAPIAHSFYLMLWTDNPSLTAVIGAGGFNFIHIYADFAGYSNFVIGISLLLGIELTQNFKFPFFTNQVRNFWQRWHLSFTQWILDFIFTPLTFYLRSWGKAGVALSILLSFVIVGLWHGLELHYVVFGLLQGLYFLPILLKWKWSESLAKAKKGNVWIDRGMIFPFFLLMSCTALIFSSTSWSSFVDHITQIDAVHAKEWSLFFGLTHGVYLFLLVLFFGVEWWNRNAAFGLDISSKSGISRWGLYLILILALMTWGEFRNTETLYAHF